MRNPGPALAAKAFSSEVETGSRQENASNQESRAPFRFNRNGKALARDPSIERAALSQSGGRVSVQAEVGSRPRHQRHQIVWMNKFIPKARVDLGIEYLLEPGNDDLVPI